MSTLARIGLCILTVGLLATTPGWAQRFQPEGFYVLQGTDKPENVRADDITPAKIAGVSLRFSWQHLEPQRDVYNWTVLDAEIERVADLGKVVTVRIQAGAWAPSWLYTIGAEATRTTKGHLMPIPWDPVMLAEWTDLVTELGARYNDNRNITGVHLSGPVSDSAEMGLPDELLNRPDAIELVFTAWSIVIDASVAAFPRKTLILNVANPFSGHDGLAVSVSEYLISRAGFRAALQNNSLSAKTDPRFDVFELLVEKSASGTHVGFQMLSGSHKSRFGGTFAQALAIAEPAAPHYFEIYQGDVEKVPN